MRYNIREQHQSPLSKCQWRMIFINSRASYLSIRKGWEEGFIDQKLNSFAAIWFIFDARPPWEIKLTLNFWGGRSNCLISINFAMEVTQYMRNTCFINENHSTEKNDLNLKLPPYNMDKISAEKSSTWRVSQFKNISQTFWDKKCDCPKKEVFLFLDNIIEEVTTN